MKIQNFAKRVAVAQVLSEFKLLGGSFEDLYDKLIASDDAGGIDDLFDAHDIVPWAPYGNDEPYDIVQTIADLAEVISQEYEQDLREGKLVAV